MIIVNFTLGDIAVVPIGQMVVIGAHGSFFRRDQYDAFGRQVIERLDRPSSIIVAGFHLYDDVFWPHIGFIEVYFFPIIHAAFFRIDLDREARLKIKTQYLALVSILVSYR